MIEDQAREDIAFIRRAIEEGNAYATTSGPDMLVCGVTVAIGYLGTYGFIRGGARNGWFEAVVAGVMGIGFFGGAWLTRLWCCAGSGSPGGWASWRYSRS